MDIYERNEIVRKHLWCIDCVIRQNLPLVAGAHLDRDDVYQSLAERMIRAVARYDRAKGRSLKGYLCDQMKYELLTCAGSKARYGFAAAPYSVSERVVSIESLEENNPCWENLVTG